MKAVIGLIAAVVLSACGGGGVDINAQIPAPATTRSDIKFGYFGALEDMAGVYTHTNIYYDMGFAGLDYTISGIRAANMDTALGIDYILWDKVGSTYTLKPDAQNRLRAFLAALKQAGVLNKVIATSLIDEPDNKNITGDQLEAAAKITRETYLEFGSKPALFSIYGPNMTWPGVGLFDWVGFDKYHLGSGIFINGDYARLKSVLRPDQWIILVPGGAEPWLQEPQAFINIAQGDKQVVWIMPFTWFTNPAHDNDYGKGIRDNAMRRTYCLAGQFIIGKTGGCGT